MITREQLYVLDYYKKNTYMGSDGPLYYRIYRVEKAVSEAEDGAEQQAVLEAVCWPGPFIYDRTDDNQKHFKQFEYSEEGMEEIISWLMKEKLVLCESKEKFLKEENQQ